MATRQPSQRQPPVGRGSPRLCRPRIYCHRLCHTRPAPPLPPPPPPPTPPPPPPKPPPFPEPPPNLSRRFWSGYLRPQVPALAAGFALMVIEGSALGGLSYLLKPLFDQVFAPGGSSALMAVGLGILALFAVRAVCVVSSRTLMAAVAQRVSAAMQADLLRHILTLDAGFFQTNAPGVLIERVQGDTIAVQGIWSSLLTGIGRDALGLALLFGVAISIDPY